MARKRLKGFHLIDSSAKWLLPLRNYSFQKQGQINLPVLFTGHGYRHRRIASFWFRTDGQCEIGVEVTGHSGQSVAKKGRGICWSSPNRRTLPGTYFAYEILLMERNFDPDREFGFELFPKRRRAKFTVAFGGCSGFSLNMNRFGVIADMTQEPPCFLGIMFILMILRMSGGRVIIATLGGTPAPNGKN